MLLINKIRADAIWSSYKSWANETAPLIQLCKCLGISMGDEMTIIAKLLGDHSWFYTGQNLEQDSMSYRVDYEGFKRIVQFVNEKKELLDNIYFETYQDQQKKIAEALNKFYRDIIDRFNNKPKENAHA